MRAKSPCHEPEIERLRCNHAPIHDVHPLEAAKHFREKYERQIDRESREKDKIRHAEFRAVRGGYVDPIEEERLAAGKEDETPEPNRRERPDDRAHEAIEAR